MNKAPILIIGGTGFCGPHLARQLIDARHSVRVMSRRGENALDDWTRSMLSGAEILMGDMTNPFDLANAMTGADTVVHAASASKSRNSDVAIERDIEINLKGTVSIINAASRAGVRRLVYFSSAGAIYGTGQARPYIESDSCHPLSSYGIVKLAAESYITHLGEAAGLSTLIPRISNPYGPGQTGADGQGILAVFSRLIRAGKPVRLFGDGSAERDYIQVEQAMQAVRELMELGEEGLFNIGSGHSTSIREIVDIMENVLGMPIKREYVPAARSADLGHVRINTDKMIARLGWRPEQNMEPGLRRFLDWDDQVRSAAAEV